jgi:hypothetical protein
MKELMGTSVSPSYHVICLVKGLQILLNLNGGTYDNVDVIIVWNYGKG